MVLVVLSVKAQTTIVVCDKDCTERETEAFAAGFLLAMLSGSITTSFGSMMGMDMISGMMVGTTTAPITTETTTTTKTTTTTAPTVTVTPAVYYLVQKYNLEHWTKYMDMFEIKALSSMIICKDMSATIRCTSPSTLIISEGFYGIREDNLCLTGPTTNLVQTCSSSTANNQVKTLCNGNTQCTLIATDATFVNSCTGVKYLEVKYRCS